MKKRWFDTLALLLVLVMTLSACGSDISNEVDSESSSAIEPGNNAGQAEDYTEQEIPDNTADEEPHTETEPLTVQSANAPVSQDHHGTRLGCARMARFWAQV